MSQVKSIFSEEDSKRLKKSVRKDSYWKFIRNAIYKTHAKINKDLTISEIGCGMGDVAILCNKLCKVPLKRYYAIEGSKEMLKELENEHIDVVETILGDVEQINFPKSDIFISKFSFHHIENKEKIMSKINNNISKNGSLIIIDKFPVFGVKITEFLEYIYHKLNIKKTLGKHYYYSLSSFKKILEQNNFVIEDSVEKRGKKFKNFFLKRVYIFARKE